MIKTRYGKQRRDQKTIQISDKQAALWALNTEAFQDGVELETAIVLDDDVYDVGRAQKEIKAGVTLEDCQCAFVLEGDSDVEFEMSELISFGSNTLTKTFKVE